MCRLFFQLLPGLTGSLSLKPFLPVLRRPIGTCRDIFSKNKLVRDLPRRPLVERSAFRQFQIARRLRKMPRLQAQMRLRIG